MACPIQSRSFFSSSSLRLHGLMVLYVTHCNTNQIKPHALPNYDAYIIAQQQ